MAFLVLGANSVSGYTVKNSLRFNSGSSDYLVRTPSSTTNQQIFTFSTWFKFSDVSATYNNIASFGASSVTNGVCYIDINSSKQLEIFMRASGVEYKSITTQLFRDVSAWYHIVIAVDTTQATSTNRTKVYVNGSQVSAFSTQNAVPQNTNLLVNTSSSENRIGASKDSGGGLGSYFNGYQTDIFLIDGQQLTPSSFGETDTDTGIWKPKAYTGTYGTNGFYLQFKNSASLGTDSSGNGNTFTVNNLTSIDQTTDTPTNNFCTINSVAVNTANIPTMTDGNLTALSTTGSNAALLGTIAIGSGKWYYEAKCISGTLGDRVLKLGWANPDKSPQNQFQASIVYRNSDGNKYIDNSGSAYGATYTDGDIIGVALDISGGTVTFYKNGTTQGTITISGALDDGTFYIPYGDIGNTDKVTFNFGNPPYTANGYTDGAGYGNFSYAVPSGYYSLNTKNLANFG